jgi:cytoskeleton protein RodZ
MTSNDTAMPETVRGIGEKLRQARVRAGLTPAEAGQKLKTPTHVVEALEREDWARIGAPVFVRGHLRSYARLLGLPEDAMTASVAVPAPQASELVPRTYTPWRQRAVEQTTRRLVYIAITGIFAVPVWLATRSHLDGKVDTVSLDHAPQTQGPAGKSGAPGGAPPSAPAPLVASMTPPMPAQPTAAADLTVTFSGESWVRLSGADGNLIEQALVASGQSRSFRTGELGKAVLGNAQAISVRLHGQPVDLTPYIRANVVRFTVSSDGSLQPVDR